MTRLFFILWFGLVIAGNPAAAQNTGKIAGSVKDRVTGEPLVGVSVQVEGTRLGAATDLSGEFFIINIPPGMYRVVASAVGYARMTQTDVRVRIDQTSTLSFLLTEEAIQGQEVVVVAQRPRVELDLTASKTAISQDQIANSWAKSINEVVSDISSANINGGIRGSFGNDVSFRLDGLDLRDVGSNTNFASVNMSTVQEVEVLTGGWNAEYGQANGSIINIVSRKATDRLRGIVNYKTRPAGQYHWGRNIYDRDDVFHTVMTSPAFWDTAQTWRTPWMGAGESQRGNLGDGKFASMTPQQKADWWRNFVNDEQRFPQAGYTERTEWEQEITLYGPLAPGLGFLVSGRYKEGVGLYPSAVKYNPDMTIQGSLDWTPADNTVLSLSGLYTQFLNTGSPRTSYQSSETIVADNASQNLPFISDPYNKFKYWLWGPASNGGSFGDGSTMRAPERAQLLNVQAKWTQIFSAETFLNVAVQHSQMEYRLDFRDIAQTAFFRSSGLPLPTDSVFLYGVTLPSFGKPPTSNLFDTQRWGYAGDVWRSESNTQSTSIKVDLTSQVTKHHLLKAGALFSIQRISTLVHEGNMISSPYVQVNDIVPIVDHPYEGAAYLQDKIEVGAMVLNLGIRFDFFNANKNVSSDFFDPLMLSEYTVGNSGRTGLVGYRQDGSGPGYSRTPLRTAFSPRIGISHPITETTVLRFMFGVFNQRPAWVKLLSNPVVWTDNRASGNLDDLIRAGMLDKEYDIPDTTLVTYRYLGAKVGNPALTWERMTQYEVGIIQNIADVLSLDVTMYYKEGRDLTSLGVDQGPSVGEFKESGGNVDVRLYGDPFQADNRDPGVYIGNFTTTVNGAWADVRGLEANLRSRLPHINFDLGYTLSYLATGRYHYSKLFKPSAVSGVKLADDTYAGANNNDGGGIGLDDNLWNPHNAATLKLSIVSPEEFGPTLGGIYPLGDWVLSTSTRWVQGNEYTWYPSDYTGVKLPNNRRWDDRWSTNLNLSRRIRMFGLRAIKISLQVTNLFNQKHLRLFSGTTLDNYLTNGILPFQATTKEPTVWNWYTNLPRQIYFGTTIEF